MGQALRATGRDIVYSVCEWGANRPWEWGASVDAHMWRTSEDIFDSWESVSRIGFELQAELHPYAGPGHWNDPDMLVVGMQGKGHVGRGGLTEAEYRSHFALWCLLASLLMIGCDVRTMDEFTRSMLFDGDVTSINQDPLGCGFEITQHSRPPAPNTSRSKPVETLDATRHPAPQHHIINQAFFFRASWDRCGSRRVVKGP